MEKPEARIEYLNPEGLYKSPVFSQAVCVSGAVKTLYIGGQNAVDKDGKPVGKDDLEAQAAQVLKNLETLLAAAGADFSHIIKFTLYLVQGQSPEKGLKVFQPALAKMKNPPLITSAFVASLANPDFLMELEAVAVVPE